MKLLNTILKNDTLRILLFLFISLAIFAFSYNFGIFWDNVLFVSKLGSYLYNNGIFIWMFPDVIDSGHPPAIGFLNALFWKIFGKELWVTHLVMIPFTIGLFYQIHQLVSFYIKNNLTAFLGLILIFADPTLATQLVIVNPEVIQLFFFFLAINAVLRNNFYLKTIALLFLSIISLRSMMLCGGVFLFEFLNSYIIDKQKFKSIFNYKFIIGYSIGSIPGLLFLSSHYLTKGWIFSHPNSPWEAHHHLVSISEFLKNLLIMTHRFLDFGRIFIFIFIVFSFFKFKNLLNNKSNMQLLLLSITSVIIVVIASLLKTNPFGHRYFIACYIFLILFSFIIIQNYFKNKSLIYTLLLAGLLSGNMWIYPRNISQGWDASLAHLPYHSLRTKAIQYLDDNAIKIEETTTFFPNATSLDNVDLSGDIREFERYSGINDYIFYSNVYNLTDDEYENIDNNYTIVKKFEKARIHIYIYKRNNYEVN